MIRAAAIRSAGAAVLLAASVMLLGAGSAAAATDNTITFDAPQPAGTTVKNTSSPTISGHVTAQGCITGLELVVSLLDAQGQTASQVAKKAIAGPDPQSRQNDQLAFSWAPQLAANGWYKVTATASYQQPFCADGLAVQQFDQPVNFKLSVAPAEPTGVKVSKLSTDRTFTVTWTKNSEPDLGSYLVYRSRFEDGACPTQPATADRLNSTKATTFTDKAVPDAGGTFCYFVQATRPDADGNDLPSPFSTPATTASVTPLPGSSTTSTTDSAGDTGNLATTSPTTGGLSGAANDRTTAGQPNVNGFASSLNGTKRGAPKVAATPDGGFNETLPFKAGAQPASADDKEDGADDPNAQQAAGPNAPDAPDVPGLSIHATSKTNRVHTLGAFAGGLVMTVIAGHLLLLRREVNRPSDLEVAGSAGLPG